MFNQKSEAQRILDAATVDQIKAGTHGTCVVCGRVCAIYTPKGGDGSQSNVKQHNRDLTGSIVQFQKCPGSNQECKETKRNKHN